MPNKPAGFQWLKEKYHLSLHTLTHCSYIGNNDSIELTNKGNIEQIYGPKYAPNEDSDFHHLEFGLKYDDLNLDFLRSVFEQVSCEELTQSIETVPNGKYSRKIGFLYEWLTGLETGFSRAISGNYVDLLDEEHYVTGNVEKNAKWKINNNLLGTQAFCPIVRRTTGLKRSLGTDISEQTRTLEENYSSQVFKRAIQYLYGKETRSSYEIEREKPTRDRIERFIRILINAGKEQNDQILEKKRLIGLQHSIVDPRFAVNDFRNFQNYVGEMLGNYEDLIHYICPPPQILSSLMEGLQQVIEKTYGTTPAEIRAAIISFAFVFIHPFEDGNGRLHRFLIHDILAHDGVVPNGMIIPVSAHMLNNIREYDNILERYSKPLMQRVRYEKSAAGAITITNLHSIEGYYRYPDLTSQCIYLLETIHATLQEDMPNELTFLQRYDEAKRSLQDIVDMPDREINQMLIFLHQNKGIFPKKRRNQFDKLTDNEIALMQQAYRSIYEMDM